MENIIKRAIEGGFKIDLEMWERFPSTLNSLALIDPLFWQALGKACGWIQDELYKGDIWKGEWVDKGVNFHRKNLTEGFDKAVAWLEKQINI